MNKKEYYKKIDTIIEDVEYTIIKDIENIKNLNHLPIMFISTIENIESNELKVGIVKNFKEALDLLSDGDINKIELIETFKDKNVIFSITITRAYVFKKNEKNEKFFKKDPNEVTIDQLEKTSKKIETIMFSCEGVEKVKYLMYKFHKKNGDISLIKMEDPSFNKWINKNETKGNFVNLINTNFEFEIDVKDVNLT